MNKLKATLKTALLVSLCLVAAAGLLAYNHLRNRTQLHLEEPAQGDVYVVRMSYFSAKKGVATDYGLLRVQGQSGNVVLVQPSRMRSASKQAAYRYLAMVAGGRVAFDEAHIIRLDRNDLMLLHKQGVILAAQRQP